MNKKFNSPMVVTIVGCILTGIVTLGCIAIVDASDALVSQFTGMRNDLHVYGKRLDTHDVSIKQLQVESQDAVHYTDLQKFAMELQIVNTNPPLHVPKVYKASERQRQEMEETQ